VQFDYGIDLWCGLAALDDSRESIPGALPQAGMKRAFGASSLWKMIDRPSGPLEMVLIVDPHLKK
jgi:hypothetical protein